MVSQVQELVCMAEKQSEEENAIFISKQKQTRVKLLFCCCTRKQGQGSAQVSAEGSCSWLSLILCPMSCSHSQHRCRGWDRLLLDSSPGCHCPVPQRGPEGERLPSGSSAWLMPLQGAGGRRGSVTTPTLHPLLSFQGECFSLAQHTPVPFTPPALAVPPEHNRMVYFGVSSYFFNTASFAYHTAGALIFDITDAMVRSRGVGSVAGRLTGLLCTTVSSTLPRGAALGTGQGLRCPCCTHEVPEGLILPQRHAAVPGSNHPPPADPKGHRIPFEHLHLCSLPSPGEPRPCPAQAVRGGTLESPAPGSQ